jgi:hypothetical protein
VAYLTKPVRQVLLFDCLTGVMGHTSAMTGHDKSSPADSAMWTTKRSLSETKIISVKRILVATDETHVNENINSRRQPER